MLTKTVEVIHMARAMLRGIDRDLSLPSRLARSRLIDIPEICLIAAIVVAVKHFLPFPTGKGKPSASRDVILPQMDWLKWSELMRPTAENLQTKPHTDVVGSIDGDRLANADDATFDAILDLLSSEQGGSGEGE